MLALDVRVQVLLIALLYAFKKGLGLVMTAQPDKNTLPSNAAVNASPGTYGCRRLIYQCRLRLYLLCLYMHPARMHHLAAIH